MGLLNRVGRGYTFPKSQAWLGRSVTLSDQTELFAEIALDVNIKEISERLFTYEIPEHLRTEIFVGSQVLVPFGRQELVSGLVVSIRNRRQLLSSASSNGEQLSEVPENTKAITEVLDSNPVFEPKYIEFLYWISEYYLCSISDVLAAALPAEIAPRIKRMVRLIPQEQEAELVLIPSDQLQSLSQSPQTRFAEEKIKSTLVLAGKDVSLKTLKERCGITGQNFYAALARLRRKGELQVFAQADETAAPKTISYVIWTGAEAKTKRQEEILTCLKRHNSGLPMAQLIEESKCSSSTIKRMVDEGILSVSQLDSFRDPLKGLLNTFSTNKPDLTSQQADAMTILLEAFNQRMEQPVSDDSPAETPYLLHGVTGSGKTEIYLRLIEEAFSRGRTALLLVPEISLTPQLAQRLVMRFGEQVAVWHSALSHGERFDSWRRIQSGELKLVLGARSGILAHIPNLGLIILDEEHDGSYKQSTPSPRYSAKRLAVERARKEGCFVLFGSATPDASTYFEAKQCDRIVQLPNRVFQQALPEAILVDMRQEYLAGNKSIISRLLQEELAACLERKEQAILLINRRGYASHVFCRACGHVLMCRHCSVSLVFHSKGGASQEGGLAANGRLSCHHCAFTQKASEECPACHGPFLKQFGMGTQKVEEECKFIFPEARILRLDSDISARKGATEEIFNQFKSGGADILIGTQMIAKGLDIEKVTVVGALSADAAFNIPDFRSLERGFQLLTQVAGRAGRGEFPGKAVLQTFNTELPALLLAKNQDYYTFIEAELANRKDFEYPPYCRLIRVLASGPDHDQVEAALERVAEELSNYLEEFEDIRILGPAPCLIERIKGQFRQHLIIKNLMGEAGQKIISSFFRAKNSPPGVRLTVDVDPVDLI